MASYIEGLLFSNSALRELGDCYYCNPKARAWHSV